MCHSHEIRQKSRKAAQFLFSVSNTLIDAGSISGGFGANTSGTIGSFSANLAVQGNDLVLNVVPEPPTLLLLVAAAGIAALQRLKSFTKQVFRSGCPLAMTADAL